MTKVSIKRLDSITKNDTTATEQINSNFLALQEAIENTLSRDGTGPNFMDADLDMNSYRIINSADPVEDLDIVNKKYVEEKIGAATEASKAAINAAAQAATSAQSALVSSTNAINSVRNAEEQLNNVIQYVDEAKESIDTTINEALADVKQQALDAAQESIDTAAEQATTIVIDHAENVIKPELNALATLATEQAIIATTQAETATTSALSASQSASNAKTSASEAALHNLKNKITNCITEIPQDIKLELNDGTLTLKAGSKVYVPNGFEANGTTPKFDEVVIAFDITAINDWTGTSEQMIAFNLTNNTLSQASVERFTSGTTAPTATNVQIWYDINTNLLKYYNTGIDTGRQLSLPLCVCTMSSNVLTSIDQVFNGFGYIGSTVFALPGVKGLIPNGRNADGSLKNTEFVNSSVGTYTYTNPFNNWPIIFGPDRFYALSQFKVEDTPSRIPTSGQWLSYYSPKDNKIYQSDNGGDWFVVPGYIMGNETISSGVITSFTPKLPFRAVDYNEVKNLGATITYWDE